mmetsp:Transcript_40670/g.121299  ORF Transcript_40670/g.121299 Transcript_40670/m.121299 type:complete len:233 (-) Transcript_40670:2118-2816(-)
MLCMPLPMLPLSPHSSLSVMRELIKCAAHASPDGSVTRSRSVISHVDCCTLASSSVISLFKLCLATICNREMASHARTASASTRDVCSSSSIVACVIRCRLVACSEASSTAPPVLMGVRCTCAACSAETPAVEYCSYAGARPKPRWRVRSVVPRSCLRTSLSRRNTCRHDNLPSSISNASALCRTFMEPSRPVETNTVTSQKGWSNREMYRHNPTCALLHSGSGLGLIAWPI